MALKYVDSFSFWTTTPGTFQATTSVTISGGRASLGAVGGGAVLSSNMTAQATYILNYRANIEATFNGSPGTGIANTLPLHYLFDAGSIQSGLGCNVFGKLQFSRGSTLIGATSVIGLTFDVGVTFYDIEAKITVGASGSIECRVNGGVQIGPTTANTQATSNATADSARIRDFGSTTLSGGKLNLDHLIVMDGSGSAMNNFIGPVNVDVLPPTGDGFYTAWAVTGAANRWQAVNELDPDGDTTYISSSTVGDKDTFTHGALAGTVTAVTGCAVWVRARRDDSVTRAFKVLLRNTTPTDNLGSIEQFVGNNYQWFFQPYEVSPFTSVAWTTTEVNNVQYGVQVTT